MIEPQRAQRTQREDKQDSGTKTFPLRPLHLLWLRNDLSLSESSVPSVVEIFPGKKMHINEINRITGEVVDAAIKVHKALGPGLLESAYQACLLFELHRRGFKAETEVELPIVYDGVKIDAGYRIDLLVEDCVIVETKAVEKIHDVHKAQLISYLKLSGNKIGLLINFNVVLLKDGITRLAN